MSEPNRFDWEEGRGLTRRQVLARGGYATAAALGLAALAAACGGDDEEAAAPAGGEPAEAGVSPLEAHVLENEQIDVDTSQYKKDPPYVVAMSTQGPINGWGKMYDVAATWQANDSGEVEKILHVPANGDPNKQINDMQDLVAQKPDIILLTAMSKAALSAPVERAMGEGIPVVLCASGVESDNFVSEVGRNLYRIAFDNATALAERMGGEGNVLMFNGIAGVDTAVTWQQGATDAFKAFPGIKLVADQFANWSVADSKKAASAILQAESKIDGVWTGGSEMSIGAIQAFLEAGRPLPLFGTANPLNGFLRLAKENDIEFVGSPYPPAMSYIGVKTCLSILKGETVKKYIDVKDEMLGGETTYDESAVDDHYKPQFNDDYIDPTPVPEDVLVKEGFGA